MNEFDRECVVADTRGESRMIITRIPGRVGRYLVIQEAGTLAIVARLVGVTQEAQDRSAALIEAWSEGRNAKP